jgi:hypothetical protein
MPSVAAAPSQANQRPAWAGPSRFTWQVEEGESGAKRRTPLPPKAQAGRQGNTRRRGGGLLRSMAKPIGTKQMEGNKWRETGLEASRTPRSLPQVAHCDTPRLVLEAIATRRKRNPRLIRGTRGSRSERPCSCLCKPRRREGLAARLLLVHSAHLADASPDVRSWRKRAARDGYCFPAVAERRPAARPSL